MTQHNSTRSIVEHENGHLRVLGAACSGKTTTMLARFRWLESRGQHPAIIAYGRDHRDRLVEALLPDGCARLGRVPVWTFPQLAGELLRAAHPAARSPLSELEEHVLLERVISQESGSLRSDYRNIIESDALRTTLLSVIHILLQNQIDSGVDPGGDDRLADILRLYRAYRERLRATGNHTFYDVAWKAAGAVRDGAPPHPIRGAHVLLVDDFNDIDAGQFELLLQLAPPDGAVAVNAFGDPAGAHFRFRGTSEAFLNTHFPARYGPVDAAVAAGPVATAGAGEGQLGLFDAPAETSTRGAGPVLSGAAVAEDEIAEARWVVDVAGQLLGQGVAPAEIAVVVRDPQRYPPVLARAFDDAGIPFDPGAASPGAAERLVLGLMRGLGSRDVDAAEILRDSPLYRRVFDAFSAALELETCRQTPAEAGLLAGHIRRSSFVTGGRFSMTRFMACIDTVLEGAGIVEQERACMAGLRDDWYGYAELTKHLGGSPSLTRFLRLRRAGPAKADHARSGAVRLFTARAASGRSFEVVLLAGCAEGVFPMIESGAGYVPWAQLERLAATAAYPVELQGARPRDLLLEDERTLLDATLRRARRHLYASAPEKLEGEPVVAPSGPLRALFEAAGAQNVSRRHSLAERAARTAQQGRAGATLPADTPGAIRVERLWLSDRPAAREFTLEPFPLSPSRLKTLEGCERRFFYTRVLKLDSDDSVALRFGSWLHDMLEQLVTDGDDGDSLRAKLDDDNIDALAGKMAGQAHEGAAMEGSIRTHVARVLRGFRELEGRRSSIRSFEASEWMFEFEADGFRFNGRADRVDRMGDGGIVVVDYKTGKLHATAKTIRGRMVDTDQAEDRDWQIAFYSRAVESEYGETPRSFCYYHLSPGTDVNAIEIRIGADATPSAFADITKRRVDAVTSSEVGAVVNRGVALARSVFASKQQFERTEVRKRCRNCPFESVCERDE